MVRPLYKLSYTLTTPSLGTPILVTTSHAIMQTVVDCECRRVSLSPLPSSASGLAGMRFGQTEPQFIGLVHDTW